MQKKPAVRINAKNALGVENAAESDLHALPVDSATARTALHVLSVDSATARNRTNTRGFQRRSSPTEKTCRQKECLLEKTQENKTQESTALSGSQPEKESELFEEKGPTGEAGNEQTPALFPSSLCHHCVGLRWVQTRKGTAYMMCMLRSERYLPQPMRECRFFSEKKP